MAVRFGQSTPETLYRWLRLFGNEKHDGRERFICFVFGLIRRGNNLAEREKNALIGWLVGNGYTTQNLGDVYTVQYTHSECAAALGCSELQAKRYRSWAIDNDVLITVHPGKKGFPALFIVAPVLVSKTAEIDTGKRVSGESGFGITSGEIGYHGKSATSGNADTSRVIHSNPERGGDEWSCSRCGAHEFTLSPDGCLVICKACDTAHKPP